VLTAFRWVSDLAGVARFAQRFQEVAWVLGYEADLDADFLAIYGIDLETYPITGPRYLAQRRSGSRPHRPRSHRRRTRSRYRQGRFRPAPRRSR
jgi:hypothetical protein